MALKTDLEEEKDYKEEEKERKEIPSDFKKKYHSFYSLIQTELTQNYSLTPQEKKSLELLTYRFLVSKIVNGVCPIYTRNTIDLDRVEQVCIKHNLSYKRYPKFTGLPINFNEDSVKFTAVFFKSGRINCVGLQEDTPQYLKKMTEVLTKYEYQIADAPIVSSSIKRVSNRVYSITIPHSIKLDFLDLFNQVSGWKLIKYQNQSFPGVIKKVTSSKAKILFFKTGSMITTGVTSEFCKEDILKEFLETIAQYLLLRRNYLNTKSTT